MVRYLSGLVVSLVVMSSVSRALGQDIVTADALFTQGSAEMDAGKFDTACPLIAQSQQIDPRAGTLYTLADCEDQRGRIATASALFEDYLRNVQAMPSDRRKKHAERANNAEKRKAALAKDIPTLMIVLPAGAPAEAKVFRDGTELNSGILGIPLPIDPGEHRVVLQVPGIEPIKKQFALRAGEKMKLELEMPPVPKPEPLVTLPVEHEKKPAEKPKVVDTSPKQTFEKKSGGGIRTGGFIALGIGGAGLVVWGVTGGMSIAHMTNNVETQCKGVVCSEAGMDAVERGRALTSAATIGLGVGIAGIAAGVAMMVVGKRSGENGPAKPAARVAVIDMGPMGALFGVKGVF